MNRDRPVRPDKYTAIDLQVMRLLSASAEREAELFVARKLQELEERQGCRRDLDAVISQLDDSIPVELLRPRDRPEPWPEDPYPLKIRFIFIGAAAIVAVQFAMFYWIG